MSNFSRRIFRNKTPRIQASTPAVKPQPNFLRPLVRTVLENWETPAPEQYGHGFEEYLESIKQPIGALEKEKRTKTVLLIHTVERMMELAPDFYERAISRAGLDQQKLIEWRSDNDEPHQTAD